MFHHEVTRLWLGIYSINQRQTFDFYTILSSVSARADPSLLPKSVPASCDLWRTDKVHTSVRSLTCRHSVYQSRQDVSITPSPVTDCHCRQFARPYPRPLTDNYWHLHSPGPALELSLTPDVFVFVIINTAASLFALIQGIHHQHFCRSYCSIKTLQHVKRSSVVKCKMSHFVKFTRN